MEQMPDTSFKPVQSPLALVTEQNRLKQQALENHRQKSQDDFTRIQQVSTMASNMVQSMVSAAAQRQLNQGLKTLAAPKAELTPLEGPTTDNSVMSTPESMAAVATDKTNRKQAAFNVAKRLAPKELGKSLVAQEFPGMLGGAKAGQKNFQQSSIQVKGPDGRTKTVSVGYDTTTNTYTNPITGEKITSEAGLASLPERGYAQVLRPAGYTADGREVVADQRSGVKLLVGKDASGQDSYTPYTEKIYPKQENLPAGMVDGLAELENSGVILKEISKKFDPDYVGPVAARVGKLSQYVEGLADADKSEFYGTVAEYKNSIIKAITGAQMSEVEARRIVQQIPNENASPTAFVAGLKRAYQATQRRINAKRDALNTGGYAARTEKEPGMSAEDLDQMFSQRLGKLNGDSTQLSKVVTKVTTYAADKEARYQAWKAQQGGK